MTTREKRLLWLLVGTVVLLDTPLAVYALSPAVAANGIVWTRTNTDICPSNSATCTHANALGQPKVKIGINEYFSVQVSPSPSNNAYVATWDNTNRHWYAAAGGGGGGTLQSVYDASSPDYTISLNGGISFADAVGATTTENQLVLFSNSVAADVANTVRTSVAASIVGNAWDPTSADNHSVKFRLLTRPVSAHPVSGLFVIRSRIDGGTVTDRLTLSTAGALSVASVLTPQIGYDAADLHSPPPGTAPLVATDSNTYSITGTLQNDDSTSSTWTNATTAFTDVSSLPSFSFTAPQPRDYIILGRIGEAYASVSAGVAEFQILVDGVAVGGAKQYMYTGANSGIVVFAKATMTAAGHTLKWQGRVSASHGAGQVNVDGSDGGGAYSQSVFLVF